MFGMMMSPRASRLAGEQAQIWESIFLRPRPRPVSAEVGAYYANLARKLSEKLSVGIAVMDIWAWSRKAKYRPIQTSP